MAKTNYNKMSNQLMQESEISIDNVSFAETDLDSTSENKPVVEAVEEKKPSNDAPVIETKKEKLKTGVVCNCSVLNVRKSPSTNAEIVDKLVAGNIVVIVGEANGFYKLSANEFCMKKYISVE